MEALLSSWTLLWIICCFSWRLCVCLMELDCTIEGFISNFSYFFVGSPVLSGERDMFWRDRERQNKEQNGWPPCGQVRVLVVGDSGVGKTSLVHLIVKGSSVARPSETIGCTVEVKHTTHENSGSSSSSIKGDVEQEFFVELWDVSGQNVTKIVDLFSIHKLMRRTKTSLQEWATEIAANGTFSAPLAAGGPCGLPVSCVVIGNKADVVSKEGTRGSSGNLVDVACQWVEKQGLLPSTEELPLTESFHANGGLIAAAKEARYDKEAMMKFFRMLIRQRYFSDELPAPSPWSISPVQGTAQRLDKNLSDDPFYKNTSLCGDPYKYNMLPPLPAQRNLTPPPTLYPQQPASMPENYSFLKFSLSNAQELSSTVRSKSTDINV